MRLAGKGIAVGGASGVIGMPDSGGEGRGSFNAAVVTAEEGGTLGVGGAERIDSGGVGKEKGSEGSSTFGVAVAEHEKWNGGGKAGREGGWHAASTGCGAQGGVVGVLLGRSEIIPDTPQEGGQAECQ
jgi:hypothetical protein